MLKRLRIQGFALFEDVELELAPGLNVISGETGAGKSLVLSALALVLGARSGPWPYREGCAVSQIQAELASAHGTPGDGTAPPPLCLRRVRRPSGKSACFVGADSISARRAGELGRTLAEFAFQHAQLGLESESAFLEALDTFAGQTALRREYAQKYAELVEVERDAACTETELLGRELRERRLQEHVALLERLGAGPQEHRELRARLGVLERARDFLALSARVKSALCEREGSMEDELSALVRAAGRHEEAPCGVRSLIEALQRAAAEVQEAARAANRLELELDVEPAELARLERRRTELERAAEALGIQPDALDAALERARSELTLLQGAESRLAELQARLGRLRERAHELAQVLHERRCSAAGELQARLEAELAELCLPDARWRFGVSELPNGSLNAQGKTSLFVSFAANPGEPFGPLSRVASGGERSRLLLALRTLGIAAGTARTETLVFDEVDAGVGGEAAEAVALRLTRLATTRQVVLVTHQASIAAFAGAHFRVRKQTSKGRTTARVDRLCDTERVEELARMLSGRGQEESARLLARTLLQRAELRAAAGTGDRAGQKGRNPRPWRGRAA